MNVFRYVLVMVVTTLSAAALAQDAPLLDAPLVLQGIVSDTEGNPLEGATVEIWQTDVNGVYDHPGDSDPDELIDFQYFGTATTDEDGHYAFLTVKPGQYEPRPVHIHFKVKMDGDELLTSQFYFAEDDTNANPTILLDIEDTEDADGNPIRVAESNIYIDLNGAGLDSAVPTASQQEGPYYPVVDFSEYDNNLLNPETDEDVYVFEMDDMTEFTLLNMNTASGDQFLTIPTMNNRMVREFNEYRPYISILQFRREIGKYVDDDVVAAYEAFIYVPVDYNASDAATLMQIPGVDQTAADALIAARPFADSEAFLAALVEAAPDVDVSYAVNFLAAE